MTVWILLIVLLGLLAYLLLMPLELCLDSYQDRYSLRMGGLARASLEKDPMELIRLHLKVGFLHFYWRPSDLQRFKKKDSKEKAGKKAGRVRKFKVSQFKRLLGSFRVKSFRLEIDTGDPLLNARLYPLVFLLPPPVGDIRLNFINRNHILLEITNRPINLLKAFINH